ncbi:MULTISPECIES: hypothetical protein [unclassified Haladaptatus]|uniref:hypothetical protein n=1 Tax=unclassified Haladaptatus TaxID=2622732 RepID=UPI0023E815F9|nr:MULTISPECIES: hypothetical protein [unclassified Haladaptatus]
MDSPSTNPDYVVSLVENLISNYEAKIGPFSTNEMPEKEAVSGIENPVSRARFLTLSVAIDFNRNARTHWKKCRELWETHQWVFNPEEVTEMHEDIARIDDCSLKGVNLQTVSCSVTRNATGENAYRIGFQSVR